MAITREFRGRPLDEIRFSSGELGRAIGDLLVQRIRQRTEAGQDVNGASFAPLSGAYAKAKGRAGLPAVANLTVSGRMLNEMQVQNVSPDGRTITVGFVAQGSDRGTKGQTFVQRSRAVAGADKAFYHCETGAGGRTKRDFFGISEADADAMLAEIERFVDDNL